MTLDDLLFVVNDSTWIQLVNSDTQDYLLDEAIQADNLEDDKYADCIVMDITVWNNIMYIDLNIEDE